MAREQTRESKNAVFWGDKHCDFFKNLRFVGIYRLQHQGGKNARARDNVRSNQRPKYAAKKYFKFYKAKSFSFFQNNLWLYNLNHILRLPNGFRFFLSSCIVSYSYRIICIAHTADIWDYHSMFSRYSSWSCKMSIIILLCFTNF